MTQKDDKDHIRELAQLLDETNLTEIEIETDGKKIRIARQMTHFAVNALPDTENIATPPSPEIEDLSSHPGAVSSPMVGTIYLAPEPNANPFCQINDPVTEGQTLFIIEAMKTMNPIIAPKSGMITKICINNAQPIEFGDILAIIE